jgi:hypothetical protein
LFPETHTGGLHSPPLVLQSRTRHQASADAAPHFIGFSALDFLPETRIEPLWLFAGESVSQFLCLEVIIG